MRLRDQQYYLKKKSFQSAWEGTTECESSGAGEIEQ